MVSSYPTVLSCWVIHMHRLVIWWNAWSNYFDQVLVHQWLKMKIMDSSMGHKFSKSLTCMLCFDFKQKYSNVTGCSCYAT
jgi:hypothetical protein